MTSLLRIGLLGAGRIGQVHANSVAQANGATITAVYDLLPDNAKSVAEKWNAKVMSSAEEVINSDEVDAVMICSPTDQHLDHITKAASAGKHIFAEKPMATNSEDCRSCTDAVERAGVKFVVGFNRRLDANHVRLRNGIEAGEVGELLTIHIISRDPAPPPASYVKVSGGMFKDCSVHDFDMARFLAGSEVESVYARVRSVIPEIGAEGDHDVSVVSLQHENGVMTTIENSRQTNYGYDQRVEVFGTKASLCAGNLTPDAVTKLENGAHTAPYHDFFMTRYTASYTDEVLEFAKMIQGSDRKYTANAKDGLMSVVVAEAANLSVKENRPVKISEILGKAQQAK